MNACGKNIRIEIFGESHGDGQGVIIDGLKPGIRLDMDYIMAYMSRRRSDGVLSTARAEEDIPEILSGVYNGCTTGAPLAVFIRNTSQKSSDYQLNIPRPSHADYPAFVKYKGYADLRGGGHFSGRMTAPLVFAGALIAGILENMGIVIGAHLLDSGGITDTPFDSVNVDAVLLKELKNEKVAVINKDLTRSIINKIKEMKEKGDSMGGIIECAVTGLKAGIGSPFFMSLESVLSSLLFSVPAVKGVEFGLGFAFAQIKGSKANDSYYYEGEIVRTMTNNNGGILGGITSGMPVVFRCALKPTPSIYLEQDTVDLKEKKDVKLTISGRHDPFIALRALPVIEGMAAIGIYDLILDSDIYES